LSGIVGILQRDDAPVDAQQLRRMVDCLKHFGPDAQDVWVEGCVGFGQALLRATDASSGASGVASEIAARPYQHLHIAADVYLDSRAQLQTELIAAGCTVASSTTDEEYLVHAYAAWGADCVQHLRGAFAFAIWDAKAQRIFCAHDHFGIKPFYYALFDSVFLFSNALDVLLLHPRVSGQLNEEAVGDFLLFGLNCNNSTTTFRDIQRLAPAHSLVISREEAKLGRYWDVPTDGRIRYARAEDYVENFLAIWNSAVADRLDAGHIGIFVSGGLDSAAVAATANSIRKGRETGAQPGPSFDLHAYTIAHNYLNQDRDPANAAKLTSDLGIPLQVVSMDDVRLFEQFEGAQPIASEPVDDPQFAGLFLPFQRIMADSCRVVFSGEGSDNLMHFEMWPYAADLRRNAEWRRLLSEVSQYMWRRPFPWRGLRVRLQGLLGRGESAPQPFPKWLATDFAKRLNLRARWEAGPPRLAPPQRHPIRPVAHASLYLPQWTCLFESESPGVTKCPVEVRFPFLDLRVVEYLLAIPPFPWFFQKALLRQAMAGRVHDSVRLRPKSPFVGDPLLSQLQRSGPYVQAGVQMREVPGSFGGVRGSSEVDLYINRSFLSPLHGKMSHEQVHQMARPICFNFWLQSIRRVGYN
jgi:asparagine synthase (glutamine-hydrolysing)